MFVLVSVGNISAQESRLSAQEYKLWYDRPAQVDVYKRQVAVGLPKRRKKSTPLRTTVIHPVA